MATKRSGAQRRRNRAERRAVAGILGNVTSCIKPVMVMKSHDIAQKHVNLVQPAKARDSWKRDNDGVLRPDYLRQGHMRTTYGFEPLVTVAQGGKDYGKTGRSIHARRMDRLYKGVENPRGDGSGVFVTDIVKHNGVMAIRKELQI